MGEPDANGLAVVLKGLADLLCKVPANVLAGFASFLGGAASGGAVALALGHLQFVGPSAIAAASAGGYLSVTTGAAASASCAGTYAFALGNGATALAVKEGIAIAIGNGASATAIGSIAVAIAPYVLAGIGVGALIGLLGYAICHYMPKAQDN